MKKLAVKIPQPASDTPALQVSSELDWSLCVKGSVPQGLKVLILCRGIFPVCWKLTEPCVVSQSEMGPFCTELSYLNCVTILHLYSARPPNELSGDAESLCQHSNAVSEVGASVLC